MGFNTFTLEVLRGTDIIKQVCLADVDVAMERWKLLLEEAEEGDFLRFFSHGSLLLYETKQTFPPYKKHHHHIVYEYK